MYLDEEMFESLYTHEQSSVHDEENRRFHDFREERGGRRFISINTLELLTILATNSTILCG